MEGTLGSEWRNRKGHFHEGFLDHFSRPRPRPTARGARVGAAPCDPGAPPHGRAAGRPPMGSAPRVATRDRPRAPGAPLPAPRALAAILGLAGGTVVEAY